MTCALRDEGTRNARAELHHAGEALDAHRVAGAVETAVGVQESAQLLGARRGVDGDVEVPRREPARAFGVDPGGVLAEPREHQHVRAAGRPRSHLPRSHPPRRHRRPASSPPRRAVALRALLLGQKLRAGPASRPVRRRRSSRASGPCPCCRGSSRRRRAAGAPSDSRVTHTRPDGPDSFAVTPRFVKLSSISRGGGSVTPGCGSSGARRAT